MLSWLSVDAVTGAINSLLPDIEAQGDIKVTMGRSESLQFTLPLPESVIAPNEASLSFGNIPAPPVLYPGGVVYPAGTVYPSDGGASTHYLPTPLAEYADFKAATTPGRSVLIALDELDAPIWGGLILTRTFNETAAVSLSAVTLEAYFDRRYVGSYNVIGRDQNLIVQDLIEQFVQNGTLPGLPIRIAYTPSATTQSQLFNSYDDKTIYSILGTLSGALGGPEWTVSWERQHAPERITPVLTVADRLGTAAAVGLFPNALFSLPGSVTTFTFVEDYSSGKGANRVTANGSTGSGITRPTDTEAAADFAGRPTFELHYQPQTVAGVTVADHAMAAVDNLAPGTRTLELTASIEGDTPAPVLGVDWNLGDDIAVDIDAPSVIDGSLRSQVGRCVGWARNDHTCTPTLFVQDASLL